MGENSEHFVCVFFPAERKIHAAINIHNCVITMLINFKRWNLLSLWWLLKKPECLFFFVVVSVFFFFFFGDNQFTEGQGLAAPFCLFHVSLFSATPLGVIAQVRQDSTFAHKLSVTRSDHWSSANSAGVFPSLPWSLALFPLPLSSPCCGA